MNRASFLAEVHELAEQLGRRLYDLVAAESERVRAQALELATAQLRATVGGESEQAEPAAASRRNPPRCAVCDELGHNARRHKRDAPTPPEPTAPPGPDDDEEPTRAAVLSPPPARPDRFSRIEAAATRRRADGA